MADEERAEREARKQALAEAKRQEEEERKRRLDEIAEQERKEREESKAAFLHAKQAEEAARQARLAETPKEVFEAGRSAVRAHHRLGGVAHKIVARGPGLEKATVGKRTTFEVLHRDEHVRDTACAGVVADEAQGAVLDIGDDLQVQFFGPAQIDGDFDEAEAGRYALSFVPPKAGQYEVHVMLQSVHVPGAHSSPLPRLHKRYTHTPDPAQGARSSLWCRTSDRLSACTYTQKRR